MFGLFLVLQRFGRGGVTCGQEERGDGFLPALELSVGDALGTLSSLPPAGI